MRDYPISMEFWLKLRKFSHPRDLGLYSNKLIFKYVCRIVQDFDILNQGFELETPRNLRTFFIEIVKNRFLKDKWRA